MMGRPYRVFLSAASLDLKSFRQAATKTLDQHAARICKHGPLEVIYQEEFPPDYRDVWEILRQRILECDAVICLVGYAYGREPRNVPPGFRRRSYTQMEFDIARALGKPVFLFRADDPSALDRHEPEPEELRNLQEQYRDELRQLDQVRDSFKTKEELLARLEKLDLPPPSPRKPVNLPYTSIGTLFKGRDAFLKTLREKLGAAPGRAVGVVARQALYGLGGVGKTRLAIEYAWQNQADYTALLFLSAPSAGELQARLADLVGVLAINTAETAVEPRLAEVLRWLDDHPGWLLILDNVDTPEAASEVVGLLAKLKAGHVLITSRIADWGADVEPLELHLLADADAVAFLLERTRNRRRKPDDTATAAAIARELDGLALALEQAGAYIDKQRLSFVEYLRLWQERRAKVLQWHDERLMGYPASVAVTWETTFAQLNEAEQTLLGVLSWLAPEPIPLALFESEPLTAVVAEVREALGGLAGYSLARFGSEEDAVAVHRLVQEITRGRTAAAGRAATLQTALDAVAALTEGSPSDVQTWAIWTPLAPHVEAVTCYADAAELAEPTSVLMNDLGLYWQAHGQFRMAEPLMRRALAIDEGSYGPDHPDVARDLNSLAGLLEATNRLSESEPLMRRALAIREGSYGPDHPEVAIDLNSLAGLLRATNRLSEAEPLMRRALAIREGSLGPDHPYVALALNSLAGLLRATNRLDESEPLIRRAVEIDEGSYGPDHPEVAIDLSSLAILLQATNRLDEAEPLMRRVVTIFETSLGPDHPHVATALNNLAQLLQTTNRLDEAEPLMRRALAIDEGSYGPDHPDVARDLNNLAELLRATNRLDEAEPLMRRAVEIDEGSYGPDHPEVAIDLSSLALLLQDTNRLDEAEPLMRRVVTIFETSLGPDHPHVATALNNLAQLLQATNRLSEAEPLYRRALAIDEGSYGPDHPDVARDLNNLAELLRATNRLDEAEPLMRRAVEIYRRFREVTGHEHPNWRVVIENYRGLLEELGLSEGEIARRLAEAAGSGGQRGGRPAAPRPRRRDRTARRPARRRRGTPPAACEGEDA